MNDDIRSTSDGTPEPATTEDGEILDLGQVTGGAKPLQRFFDILTGKS